MIFKITNNTEKSKIEGSKGVKYNIVILPFRVQQIYCK